jgi:diaminohydroxyphosphoribosylaminopyrimidine deaminase / 5-amino-6-(5-phosphoribosylamino)uracil reductase
MYRGDIMDKKFMEMALRLAQKGEGGVNPNPLVGAVIVKDGSIIGEGFHEIYGGPHAEVNAFADAAKRGFDTDGATIYVTLEPCCHHGKTPPCTEAIIRNGISRVVIGTLDPNPLVAGNGAAILREAGISVVSGIMENECMAMNEVFIKYITTGRPFVVLKSAMSLDGKIATYTGESQWITCEESRKSVHLLRNKYTGILVGVGTVIADDPMLTARLEGSRNPVRIVVDTNLRIPLKSAILRTSGEVRTIIATSKDGDCEKAKLIKAMGAQVIRAKSHDGRVSLDDVMVQAGSMGIDSVLIEGGGEVNFSALSENIVDKVMYYVAPLIIGGSTSKGTVGGQGFALLSEAVRLKDMKSSHVGRDMLIEAYVDKQDSGA